MQYDRWIVSSWGRAGSLLLSKQVEFDVVCGMPPNRCKWIYTYENEYCVQPPPHSVNHNHSLKQLDYTRDSGLIIAIRNPSEAALSMYISHATNCYHKLASDIVDNMHERVNDIRFKDTHADYQLAIIEHTNRLKFQPVDVDIERLTDYRGSCIRWNDYALAKMPTATVLDYAKWNGDLEKSAKLIGIEYRSRLKRKLWTELNLIPLLDRVANKEDVKNWMNSNYGEYHALLSKWDLTKPL